MDTAIAQYTEAPFGSRKSWGQNKGLREALKWLVVPEAIFFP